jgi:hypothetical protein
MREQCKCDKVRLRLYIAHCTLRIANSTLHVEFWLQVSGADEYVLLTQRRPGRLSCCALTWRYDICVSIQALRSRSHDRCVLIALCATPHGSLEVTCSSIRLSAFAVAVAVAESILPLAHGSAHTAPIATAALKAGDHVLDDG